MEVIGCQLFYQIDVTFEAISQVKGLDKDVIKELWDTGELEIDSDEFAKLVPLSSFEGEIEVGNGWLS